MRGMTMELNLFRPVYMFIKYKKYLSLLYSTALVPNAGTDNVYLICVFIRFISCLLRKVKY